MFKLFLFIFFIINLTIYEIDSTNSTLNINNTVIENATILPRHHEITNMSSISLSTTPAATKSILSTPTNLCTNANNETCDFYFNIGAKCDSSSVIDKIPFNEYCCDYCKNNAANTSVINPLLSCKNYNNQTCQNYFNNGYKCNSITYINQIPIFAYCCESCFASLTENSLNTNSSSDTVTFPTTCTKNVNDNVCIFNYQLGGRCDKISYIENSTFQEYCCASCKNLNNAPNFEIISRNACINYDNDTCNYYFTNNVKCDSISYIENIPFFTYCCESCRNNQGSFENINSTSFYSTTSITTTRILSNNTNNTDNTANNTISSDNTTTSDSTTTTDTFTSTTSTIITTTSSTTKIVFNGTCININEDTCKFYVNSGAKCDSETFVEDMLFKEYCCAYCRSQTQTTSSTKPTAVTECTNYNTDTCNYYFGMGVKCDSLSFINNIPIQVYCCSSCATLRNSTSSSTTTTRTSIQPISIPFITSTGTNKITTTQVCRNIDESTCKFYFNLGASCSAISFIDNIPFKQYCCASCNNLTTTTVSTDATTQTTTTISTTTATTTTTKQCKNMNDETCFYYFNLGAKCGSVSFINMIPFKDYCCKSCNEGINSSSAEVVSSNQTCMNYNEETCNFYFGLGAKCGSVSFINNIPFSIYCCKSCNQSLDLLNQTTTTKISTTIPLTTSTTSTTTTTACIDIDEAKCQYYFKLGADCKTISFIKNISLQTYCCKSCQSQLASESTTQSTTTIDFNQCQDLNTTLCSLTTLYSCQSNININDIPIKKYCCKRCNELSLSTLTPFPNQSTVSPQTTVSTNCTDQSSSVCSIISAYTCTTNTLVSGIPITSYCCKTCSTLNPNNPIASTTFKPVTIPDNCQDINSSICNIISPFTCTTNIMIDKIPIGIYCCRTCFLPPSQPSITTTSSPTCADYNPNICGIISSFTCTTYTYISNIDIRTYCCKTCNSFSNNQPGSSTQSPIIMTPSVCKDYEKGLCNIISKYTCNTFTFISNIPIGIYCCSTCNKLKIFLESSNTTLLNDSVAVQRQLFQTSEYGCIGNILED
jgi:hypothetical protein